jgi:hypothetical protein
MDPNRAKDILKSLADGRDPATGEQFPPNSPYPQADPVRALFMAVDALDNSARRARRQTLRPEGAPQRPIDPNRPKIGASWSPEEEQQLRDAFAAHKPIPEIAATHGRTQGAITARLVKLGLIEAPATTRADHSNRLADVPPTPTRPNRPLPSDSSTPRALTEKEKEDFPF